MAEGGYDRIEAIKQVPFMEAMKAIALENGIDLPESSRVMRCVIPGHNDKSPSFSFRDESHPRGAGFRCFGCGKHGDALDFLMAVEGIEYIPDALDRMEKLLGLGSKAEGLLATVRYRKQNAPETRWQKRLREWRAKCDELEDRAITSLRPYVSSQDGMVWGIAEPRLDWICEELHEAHRLGPPLTERAERERMRKLQEWVVGIVAGVRRDVEQATGKDALDLEAQDSAYRLSPEVKKLAKLILRMMGNSKAGPPLTKKQRGKVLRYLRQRVQKIEQADTR